MKTYYDDSMLKTTCNRIKSSEINTSMCKNKVIWENLQVAQISWEINDELFNKWCLHNWNSGLETK